METEDFNIDKRKILLYSDPTYEAWKHTMLDRINPSLSAFRSYL